MNACKSFGLLLISCLMSLASTAQTDTAFWFGAPAITSGHGNAPIIMRLSSYASPADILITMPANPNFAPIPVHLDPYSAFSANLTSFLNQIETKPVNTVLNNALKVSSTSNISAYYEMQGKPGPSAFNPEIFALKGNISKGKAFMIPGQNRFSNGNYTPIPKNGFVVVATEDNTVVEITPSKDAVGHPAGVKFSITLNKGETYSVNALNQDGPNHLVGTTVTADKLITITVYDDSIGPPTGCRDLVGDQIIPEEANGNEFVIIKGELSFSPDFGDYFYVLATTDGTQVFVNGTQITTLNRGQVYEGILNQPSAYVKTSNPVYLNQVTGIGCEMAATNLPSIRCTGSSLVSFVRSVNTAFYLNLLCKATDINGFLLDGQSNIISGSMFNAVPGTNGEWMYAKISTANLPSLNTLIPDGQNTTVSNTLGLFHLGFLNGSNNTGNVLGYFSNYAQTTLSPQIAGLTCAGSNINLQVSQVIGATYQWSGPNGFSSTIYNPTIPNANTSNSGQYSVAMNILGCGVFRDSINLTVHPTPTITISPNDSICQGKTKDLILTPTGTAPWRVGYTDGSKTDTLTIISAPFTLSVSPTAQTTYTLKSITDANSCTAASLTGAPDVSSTVSIFAKPIPAFSLSTPACENQLFNFTDQSIANTNGLARWYWNFKDGNTKDTTGGGTFSKSFAAWGTYPVQLLVESNKGCLSDTITTNVTVHPLPVVGFILPKVCLSDASALFTDTTTIADGSAAQMTYLWNFNAGTPAITPGPNTLTSTLQNPAVKYNKSADYLVSLTVSSKDGCVSNLTKTFTVNGSVPKSQFVVLQPTTLCSNDSVRIQNTSTVDFGVVTRVEITWDFLNAPSVKTIDDDPYFNKIYAYRYANFQSPVSKPISVQFKAFSGSASACADISTQVITLNQSPKVGFSTMPSICLEAAPRVILQTSYDNAVAGTFNYTGTGVSAAGVFNPSLAGVGIYPIQFMQTSAKGCKDSATQSIQVWPSPVAKWGIASPLCEKNALIFSDSSLANYSNIVQRNWVYGDGNTAVRNNANDFTYTYTSANSYTASLRVTTDSGCMSALNTQTIRVNPIPVVDFSIPQICLPDGNGQFTSNTSISDGSTALLSYRWNFNDPNDASSSTLPNPTHRFSAIGPFPIQLIVRSNNNCVDSSTKIISSIYPQPKANFNTSATEICVNDAVQFTDLSDGKTSAIATWSWNFSAGNTASIQNPSQLFRDSGLVQVALHIFNAQGCVSDTALKTITVYPYPKLDLGPDLKVLQNGQASLKPLFVYGTGLRYLWTPSTYLDADTAAIPISKPLVDITYQLALSNQGGCTVKDEIFIEVLKAPQVPNAFSPNGDGVNDTWRIPYLDTYPGATVDVFNRYGQKVFSSLGYATEWTGKLNGKALPVGTYYYVINPKNGLEIMSGSVTIVY